MTKPCIFCAIVDKTEPAFIVYEDEKVIAFLDRRQVQPGHTMVIPKQHVDHFIDLSDDLTQHIAVVGNKIGRKMQGKLKPKRVGFVVAGFGVAHAHYHVIPMHGEMDITSERYAYLEDNKICFGMDHIPLRSKEENEAMLKLIGTAS
jgi:histidine triad (HIT) family protein